MNRPSQPKLYTNKRHGTTPKHHVHTCFLAPKFYVSKSKDLRTFENAPFWNTTMTELDAHNLRLGPFRDNKKNIALLTAEKPDAAMTHAQHRHEEDTIKAEKTSSHAMNDLWVSGGFHWSGFEAH